MDNPASDEDLMKRYATGESAAFAVLYARHKGPLYRYFLRQVRPASVAEDLYQDVWTNVIRARERYEVQAKFTTWLYRLAHNRLIDHYRRTGTARAFNNADPDDPLLETFPEDALQQPDNELERKRMGQRLLETLERLPVEQREAFLLREEAGFSLEEIADVTGAGVEAAKSRYRYAIAKLRRALAPVLGRGRDGGVRRGGTHE